MFQISKAQVAMFRKFCKRLLTQEQHPNMKCMRRQDHVKLVVKKVRVI